jgi:hypothetical protein
MLCYFGLLMLAETFLTSAEARTVVASVVSNTTGIVNASCVAPAPVTDFTTSSPQVWIYFEVTDVKVGEPIEIDFTRPDGATHQTFNSTAPFKTSCFAFFIPISGAAAASYPGRWTVEAFWSRGSMLEALWPRASKPLFALNFNISGSGPTAAPTYSPRRVPAQAGEPSLAETMVWIQSTVNNSGAALMVNTSTSYSKDFAYASCDISAVAEMFTTLDNGYIMGDRREFHVSLSALDSGHTNITSWPATDGVKMAVEGVSIRSSSGPVISVHHTNSLTHTDEMTTGDAIGFWVLPGMGQRLANALNHAIQLCGGRNTKAPF